MELKTYFQSFICVWMISGCLVLSAPASILLDKLNKTGLRLGHDIGDQSSCLKYGGPIELRLETNSDKIDFFEPFLFRANNYGRAQYELETMYLGEPILNIRMDDGPKADTVKGGDLNGFYAFHRSFLVPRSEDNPSQIKFSDGIKIWFEIWNVYLRKNNLDQASKVKAPHEVVSLNVLFEIGNKSNARFEPILKGLRKLSVNQPRPSVVLPIDYDPYGLLPLQGSFAVYETSEFPFKHPNIDQNMQQLDSQGTSECGPLIKVYLYEKRLKMSEVQLKESQVKLAKSLQPIFATAGLDDKINHTNNNQTHEPPKIYYTPKAQHLIFRRMVADAPTAAEEEDFGDDSEYYDDEPEEIDEEEAPILPDEYGKLNASEPVEPEDDQMFPPDCAFLYRLDEVRTGKSGHEGHGQGVPRFRAIPPLIIFSLALKVLHQ